MPYKQVFHDNSDLNNKIFYSDIQTVSSGDGFGSLFSSIGNLGSKAVNFIGQNKDAMSGVASLAGGIKSVADTINSTKRANEELRQMQINYDNQVNLYQKVYDLQNKIKRSKAEKNRTINNRDLQSRDLDTNDLQIQNQTPRPTFVDKNIEDQPITYTTNNNTKQTSSSLNESQLQAIRNMNRRGEGVRTTKGRNIGNGLRVY